jgi:hypothetical protein
MTTTDKTIEPADGEALPAVTEDAALQQVRDHVANLTVEDPADVQERILRQMLKATTPNDLLRAGEATPSEEVLGMALTVTGIRASESGFVDGGDYYLHVDAVIKSNGDQITISCGATDVCQKLVLADMRGWFPMDCRIERAQAATKAGFFPLFLRPLAADGEPF